VNRVIALWAVPRSVSTAFERMMRARGDFEVLHEPFVAYYYYSEERANEHFSEGVEPDPSHDWRAILGRIQDEAQRGQVFFKDMAYQVSRCASPEFLANFENTFLTRDPEESLRSLFRLLPEATVEETGFEQQLRLMRMAGELTGEPPVLVDAGQLRSDPVAAVERYCGQVGIEFLPDALEWQEGEPDEDWRPWRNWHREAIESTGFESGGDASRDDDVEVPADILARCKELHAEILSLARR
jgi:hypothetical protein